MDVDIACQVQKKNVELKKEAASVYTNTCIKERFCFFILFSVYIYIVCDLQKQFSVRNSFDPKMAYCAFIFTLSFLFAKQI